MPWHPPIIPPGRLVTPGVLGCDPDPQSEETTFTLIRNVHALRPCRVFLGFNPTWNQLLRAEVPVEFDGDSSTEEMVQTYLPDWNLLGLNNPAYTEADADACIEVQGMGPIQGLFFDDMLRGAYNWGLRFFFTYAELAQPPEVFRALNPDMAPASIRSKLRNADWKVKIGLDTVLCNVTVQALIAWLGTGSLSWPAIIAIVNQLRGGETIGDCCDDVDIYLRVPPAQALATACKAAPGVHPSIGGCGAPTTPGAWTPFNTVLTCAGSFHTKAMMADYYLFWARRLLGYARLLESEAKRAELSPGSIIGTAGTTAWSASLRAAATHHNNVGDACARMGMANIVDIASGWAHEFSHATRWLTSHRKFHCRTPPIPHGGLGRELIYGMRRAPQECFQYMYEFALLNRGLAELGLPNPNLTRDPFDFAENDAWSLVRSAKCNILAQNPDSSDRYKVTGLHCGLLTRRRQVSATYLWPDKCSAVDRDDPTDGITNLSSGQHSTTRVYNAGNTNCSEFDPSVRATPIGEDDADVAVPDNGLLLRAPALH